MELPQNSLLGLKYPTTSHIPNVPILPQKPSHNAFHEEFQQQILWDKMLLVAYTVDYGKVKDYLPIEARRGHSEN